MAPDQYWYCIVAVPVLFASFLCSTLLIVSMNFDRFYSIIRPHKAASFNTVKRAKITIVCIIILSTLYNIPHLFITSNENWKCLPYGAAMGKPYGEFYYWFSFIINFAVPFVLLLIMNSIIIYKIQNRSQFRKMQDASAGCEGQSQGQASKIKNSDKQVYAILLLVTFGFLVLTTPGYLLFLFIMLVDFSSSPTVFAVYYLFYNVAQKLHYTNHGINFFLYVISGSKFRRDLVKLFKYNRDGLNEGSVSRSTGTETQASTI